MNSKNQKKEKIILNDLFDYGYMIYQNPDYFKFSLDSVLLAEFINIKKDKYKIIDFCTGNAPIPMILTKKYGSHLDITGVEIQKEIYELGLTSIEYNKLDNIKLINDDIKEYVKLTNEKFDIVSCNPPYFEITSLDKINDNNIKAIARHEIKITLEEVIESASKLCEYQAYFYMVHVPTRLADIINLYKKYQFGIKKIIPIYTKENTNAELILIEAIYKGKNYVKIEKPIFLNKLNSYQNIFK